jgi:GDP-4-dehydro-6-deoxy-D-mannose reductase
MPHNSILITGISGFVGGHYCDFLRNNRSDWSIHGISRSAPVWDFVPDNDTLLESIDFHQGNLLDEENTCKLIKEIDPDYILHLAAYSSVAESWGQPRLAFLNNTNAFLNVVESIRVNNLQCKILSVGSSEEYGIVNLKELPLKEEYCNKPANPYAVARVSQECLAKIYTAGYDVKICCTRSFNHIGPGQQSKFVISSIAKQFAEIVAGRTSPTIIIGNGSIVRDFIDINDVVTAYDSILRKFRNGELYNVCNGVGHTINQIVEKYSDMLDLPVQIIQKDNLMRPVDNPILFGDNKKLIEHTGWTPLVPFETSLKKIFDYWYNKST